MVFDRSFGYQAQAYKGEIKELFPGHMVGRDQGMSIWKNSGIWISCPPRTGYKMLVSVKAKARPPCQTRVVAIYD